MQLLLNISLISNIVIRTWICIFSATIHIRVTLHKRSLTIFSDEGSFRRSLAIKTCGRDSERSTETRRNRG